MDLNDCHHIQNCYFFLITKLSFWIKFIRPASFPSMSFLWPNGSGGVRRVFRFLEVSCKSARLGTQLDFKKKKTFYLMLEYSYLTSVLISGAQQNDSAICIHVSNLFQVLIHLGCSMILSQVPCAIPSSLLVIHFKYSSVKLLDLSMIPAVSSFLSGI